MFWWKNYGDPYGAPKTFEINPSDTYYSYAQAWRFLGAFIGCGLDYGENNGRRLEKIDESDWHKFQDDNNEKLADLLQRQGNGDVYTQRDLKDNNNNGETCTRYILWSGYVNPNYKGLGIQEYLNSDTGEINENKLNCHDPKSIWKLVGVYRIDVDNFFEQMAKHLWAIDEWEYHTVYGARDIMNGGECQQAANINSYGNGLKLYTALMPLPGGYLQMGLYTDSSCLKPYNDKSVTWDDLGMSTYYSRNGSGDGGDDMNSNNIDDATLATYWSAAQEYSLKNLNKVLAPYRKCALCNDYPSYQDGYLIGNYGTDSGDIINQCWKFFSHDAAHCNGDCASLANAQGTVSSFRYGKRSLGKNTIVRSPAVSNMYANIFLFSTLILFGITLLAWRISRERWKRDKNGRMMIVKNNSSNVRAGDYFLKDDDEDAVAKEKKFVLMGYSVDGGPSSRPNYDNVDKAARGSRRRGSDCYYDEYDYERSHSYSPPPRRSRR